MFRIRHAVRSNYFVHSKPELLFTQYVEYKKFIVFGNMLFAHQNASSTACRDLFFAARKTPPSENGRELINILDWLCPVVTMFALLSMNNDGYTVRMV
jgi:hypothetical protein